MELKIDEITLEAALKKAGHQIFKSDKKIII